MAVCAVATGTSKSDGFLRFEPVTRQTSRGNFSFFYLVPVRALISLFHIKDRLMCTFIINTVTLRHVSTLKGPSSGKSGSCRVIYCTQLTELNFTSGNSMCWPCCWNVSVVLPEDGPMSWATILHGNRWTGGSTTQTAYGKSECGLPDSIKCSAPFVGGTRGLRGMGNVGVTQC